MGIAIGLALMVGAIVVFFILLVLVFLRALSRGSRRRGLIIIGALLAIVVIGMGALLHALAPPETARLLNSPAPVAESDGVFYATGSNSTSDTAILKVQRLSARTGKTQWQRAFPIGSRLVTVSGQVVYVVDRAATVWALRASDGSALWRTTLHLPLQPEAAPVVGDGMVYLRSGGTVVALRASDGRQQWAEQIDGINTSAAIEALTAGGGLLAVTLTTPGVLVLHATDGSHAWQSTYVGVPVIADGVVYVRNLLMRTVALRASDGMLLWQLSCGDTGADTDVGLTVSGMRVYEAQYFFDSATGGGQRWVCAFDAQSRRLLWKYAVSDVSATPVPIGENVYIASDTHLDAVRASDGRRLWRMESEEPNAGVVALGAVGNTLYAQVSIIYPHTISFGCSPYCQQSFSISAIRPSDGALYWRYYLPYHGVYPYRWLAVS